MERLHRAKVAGADLEGAFMNNPDDIVSVLINNLDGFISVHAGPPMVARRRSQGMARVRQLAPPASQADGARAGDPYSMVSWTFMTLMSCMSSSSL